ncbi:MAG: class I SAM-dependent methyltransferase [Pseudomonadota bacterium]
MHESGEKRVSADLSGVPETMLWPLWHRAQEMKRRDRLIEDPLASALVGSINYDFRGRFGRPSPFHPVRARVTDDLVRSFAERHASPQVIALGEGLDTAFWRINDPRIKWLSVDVPEASEFRRTMLPTDPRLQHLECSALDFRWMDEVVRSSPPFITACGLLMYFKEPEVRRLLCAIAKRFPGSEVFFDTITPFFSRQTIKGFQVTRRYKAPPMPWGITLQDLPDFIRSIPNLEPVNVDSYAAPFPNRMFLFKLLTKIPPIRRLFGAGLVHARVNPEC